MESVQRLRLADGSPVRAASAVVPLGDGFLVVQDDATHGAWFRAGSVTVVRLLPPVDGLELFEEASGTKHLKPDLEAACGLEVDGEPAVLMLGSGSHGSADALVTAAGGRWAAAGPGSPTWRRSTPTWPLRCRCRPTLLNMEGRLPSRWRAAVVPPGTAVCRRARGKRGPGAGSCGRCCPRQDQPERRHGEQPEALRPRRGRRRRTRDHRRRRAARRAILLSAAAEDSPNPRDDGPVVASALVRLDGDAVEEVTPLPLIDGRVCKVEGLMLLDSDQDHLRLLARRRRRRS